MKLIDIEEYLPNDPVQRMRYIQGLPRAFSFKIGEYRFNSRNNSYNAISIWKIDEQADEVITLQKNTRIVSELQVDAPQYHTRAMRANYLRTCDLLLPKAKSSSLRTIYQMLTGDVSATNTINDAKVDERVRLALELGDSEIVINLREHKRERSSKYDTFWKIAAQFLAGKAADAVTAVDECRHGTIVHLATAISSLKDEPFETFTAASETEMERFWETIQLVDGSVTNEDCTAEHIKQRPLLQEFLEHCCTAKHYSFTIKKCGEPSCTICRSPRCSPEDFEQLYRLPDPVPGEDMHYKSFEELYGKQTTEDHRPSLILRTLKQK
ncbi:uncharacterized protein OCT59_007700 [Rhizophagus irregularis]|uniref:uncharacterized protein n=1 Tax=Rhizophagus irregularis TaxID=588596 RepID=UPI00331E8E61|nr:hypothetical protein OCT59_007700 [Rhizophagus irregularis]